MSESIFKLRDVSDITCQWLKTPNWTTNSKLLCSLQIWPELVGGAVRCLLVNLYASLGNQLWDPQPMFFQFSVPVGFLHTEFCILEERYRFRFIGSNQVQITLEKLDPTIIFSPSCTNQSEFACCIAQWYLNTVAGGRQIIKNKNNLFYLFSWLLLCEMWKVKSLMNSHHCGY